MTPIRIAIIGPESTGKTRLADQLAQQFGTVAVPEIAREWIPRLGRPYLQQDLLVLSHLQAQAEDEFLAQNPSILICDTNVTVIRIWSLFKFGAVDPAIIEIEQNRHYDLILLTATDIPWEEDPLRENPAQRIELYSLYYRGLIASNRNFSVVFGQGVERFQRAVAHVNRMTGLL